MVGENNIISINKDKLFTSANDSFLKICRLEENSKKHAKMYRKAMEVHDNGIDGININAIVSFYDKSIIKNKTIVIGDIEIDFEFLQKVDKDSVNGVYFYALTVGECNFESEEKIMDFLYADIWGTSYVDAAEEEVRHILSDDAKERLGSNVDISKSMGPGYFGMSVGEAHKIAKVLDYDKIGIRIKESGMLIPQKSCSGFYLVLTEGKNVFPNECMYCSGNSLGCEFCRIRGGRFQ